MAVMTFTCFAGISIGHVEIVCDITSKKHAKWCFQAYTESRFPAHSSNLSAKKVVLLLILPPKHGFLEKHQFF